MVKLSREITLFAIGGVGGLVVDTGIVQLLVGLANWNPYLARVPSFLLAATFTWWWNRHYTFAARRSDRAAHAELLSTGGQRTVVEGALAWNPVFDVTPAELIDAIVTERGVIERPNSIAMQAMFGW